MKVDNAVSNLPTVQQQGEGNLVKNKLDKFNSDQQPQEAVEHDNQGASEREILLAVERANASLVLPQTMFEFSIHEKTREIIVKVLNKETGELIREIPPEKILDMVAKMWEIAGILVDEKA